MSFLRRVFIDQVIHFGKKFGISGKGRSPNVAHLKVQLGENLGDQEKGRSQKKLSSLIEVPYVAHLKVQVLSFNMNNVFSPQGVHRPSYPFR